MILFLSNKQVTVCYCSILEKDLISPLLDLLALAMKRNECG